MYNLQNFKERALILSFLQADIMSGNCKLRHRFISLEFTSGCLPSPKELLNSLFQIGVNYTCRIGLIYYLIHLVIGPEICFQVHKYMK